MNKSDNGGVGGGSSEQFHFNDSLIHEMMTKLTRHKNLDIIYIPSTNEYITMSQMQRDIIQELELAGGRISSDTLQTNLRVDRTNLEKAIKQIVSGSIQFINGELISNDYLQNICSEVNEAVYTMGSVSFGSLAIKYDLPINIINQVISRNVGGSIQALVKASNLVSLNLEKSHHAQVRGACLGSTRPLLASQLATLLNIDEREVIELFAKISKEGSLPGVFNEREYSPDIYTRQQRVAVDEFFVSNRYVEVTRLKKLNVSKPIDFVMEKFPDSVELSSVIISNELLSTIQVEVESMLQGRKDKSTEQLAWINVNGFLPDALTFNDVQVLVDRICERIQQSSSSILSVLELLGKDVIYIVCNDLTSELLQMLAEDASNAAASEAAILAFSKSQANMKSIVLEASTTMSKSVMNDESDDDNVGKSGKNRRGQKGKTIDENDSRKKNSDDKRGKKDNSKSKSSGQPILNPVDELMAQFAKSSRILKLALDYLDHVINKAVSESIDDEDNIHALVRALLNSCEDSIRSIYQRAFVDSYEKFKIKNDPTSRGKRDAEKDAKFEVMWTDLQVICKGLAILESRKLGDAGCYDGEPLQDLASLHHHLLLTRCASIAELLTYHLYLDVNEEVTFEKLTPEYQPLFPAELKTVPLLNNEERARLHKIISKDVARFIKDLWEAIERGTNLWTFMKQVEGACSSGLISLVARKVDRKKERNIAFGYKQKLMDSLREESQWDRLVLQALALCYYNVKNAPLDLPYAPSDIQGNIHLAEFLVSRLEEFYTENDMSILREVMAAMRLSHVSSDDELRNQLITLALRKGKEGTSEK